MCWPIQLAPKYVDKHKFERVDLQPVSTGVGMIWTSVDCPLFSRVRYTSSTLAGRSFLGHLAPLPFTLLLTSEGVGAQLHRTWPPAYIIVRGPLSKSPLN